jgi:HK97 family phage major capsid protein
MNEMNLTQIIERLAALDEEVRSATEVEPIEKAAAEKTELLTRKAELEALESRKQTALNIQQGIITPKTIDTRKDETKMEFANMTRDEVVASPEYRSIFLKSLMGKPLNDIEKREYDAFNAGTGVAAVPTETANMIFDQMTKIAPMLNEITLLRVAGGLRFAVQNARAAAAVHVENAPTAAAADTLQVITLAGFEFIKILSISATMSTMAVPAFEQWLVKILAEDLAVVIDNEIINSPNTTGGISDGAWNEGVNQITYVPGNGLSHANVMALIALLPAAFEPGAKFVMNKATFWTQFAAMEDANGNPIINPDLAAPGKYMVRGFPVLIDDNVAANEAYFGDFKKVVGNLSQDIKIDKSAEAGFMNNSIYFRGTAIFDCDVAQPAAIVKLNV